MQTNAPRKLLSDSLAQRLGAVDVASLSAARASKLRPLGLKMSCMQVVACAAWKLVATTAMRV